MRKNATIALLIAGGVALAGPVSAAQYLRLTANSGIVATPILDRLTGLPGDYADLSDFVAYAPQASLQRANLEFAVLEAATLTEAKMSGASLRSAKLWASDFSGADLSYADLTAADAAPANFSGANLVGANFSHAKLRAAKFRQADLRGVNFAGADLSFADFSGAIFSADDVPPSGLLGEIDLPSLPAPMFLGAFFTADAAPVWADGQPIDAAALASWGITVVEVPEPSAVGLVMTLCLAASASRSWGRSQRSQACLEISKVAARSC